MGTFIIGLFVWVILVAMAIAGVIFVFKVMSWVWENLGSIIGFFLLVGVVGALAFIAANGAW